MLRLTNTWWTQQQKGACSCPTAATSYPGQDILQRLSNTCTTIDITSGPTVMLIGKAVEFMIAADGLEQRTLRMAYVVLVYDKDSQQVHYILHSLSPNTEHSCDVEVIQRLITNVNVQASLPHMQENLSKCT